MLKITFIADALKITHRNVGDFMFKCKHRKKPENFSREGKIGFKETVLSVVNMLKRSLQIEINDFIDLAMMGDMNLSRQAYTKARENIEPEVFVDLSNSVVNGFYEKCEDYDTWNGYRVSAIDGSVLEIPNTEKTRKDFGYCKNGSGEVAKAKAVCIYDVLNHLIIKSKIGRCEQPEREAAKQLIEEMVQDKKMKELILFDRGYPSKDLIAFLMEKEVSFVMRSKQKWTKEIMMAKEEDQKIVLVHNGTEIPVRVIRFMLDSGEEEILVTNLENQEYGIKEFKELYFLRWGIEVKFDDLKNKIEVENFTGTSKTIIEQDLYASIYLANMAEFVKMHSEGELEEKNSGKALKYEYKPNLSMIIGSLKNKLVLMLLEENEERRNRILESIVKRLATASVPIRPNRHNPRKHLLIHSKHQLNKRRCL